MSTGTYTMNVNQVKKTIDITVSGSFTPEKAQEFINEYQRKTSVIKADEFTLQFDCRDLNLVTQEMVPELENCFRLYQSSGFKKIIIEIKKSAVLKMQLSRLARNTGLKNVEVTEVL